MSDDKGEAYNEEEVERRRDEALRRALNTPPHPKPITKSKKEKAGVGKKTERPDKGQSLSFRAITSRIISPSVSRELSGTRYM